MAKSLSSEHLVFTPGKPAPMKIFGIDRHLKEC